MVQFLFKDAQYVKFPPHLFNQSSQFLVLDSSAFVELSDLPYDPTQDDLDHLEKLNYLPPWYLIPYLENPSPKSSWFIRKYSWLRLYVEPDPHGFYSFSHGRYSIYQVISGQTFPWDAVNVESYLLDDILWIWARPIFRPTFLLSIQPNLHPIFPSFSSSFPYLSYMEKAYVALCPESLKYTTSEEDTLELKSVGAQSLAFNLYTTLYAQDRWGIIPEEYKGIFTRYNIVVTRMLKKYGRTEIRIQGIDRFPYLWYCKSFENYMKKMIERLPEASKPLIEEFKERQHEFIQKIQIKQEI